MKVLFDMARGQISIEGDGPELISVLQHAREIAPKLAEIRLITGPVKNAPSGEDDVRREGSDTDASEAAKGSAPRQGVATLREFVKLVSPNNLADQIPTIGGYQARYHGHDTFSPKQMADWFTHSGLQKPAQMPVALFAAKQRYGYLENPGHGKWKVSTAGENAVTRKLEEKGGLP